MALMEVEGQADGAALADDALARWRWLIARREAAIAAIRARTGDRGDYWTVRAGTHGRLLRASAAAPNPVLDLLRAEPAIAAGGALLDVGAGAGRFAIPLARTARAVTAVEPSAALRAILREDVAAAGLTNLRIVGATWEEAEVAPAEVVLCANVLTPIADAGPFLRKLDARATRAVYVVLRATPMDAPIADLWAAVHGAPYPRETTHADAYAALDALGIAAQVRIVPQPGSNWRFDRQEDATRLVRDRLWLGPVGQDPRADALVDDFLAAALERDGDGWRIPAPPPRTAIISWEKA